MGSVAQQLPKGVCPASSSVGLHLLSHSSPLVLELELVGCPCCTSSSMIGYKASYLAGSLLWAVASREMLPLMSVLTSASPVPNFSAPTSQDCVHRER